MLVHDPEQQELKTVLYNHSSFGTDEEIGRVTFPLKDLPPGEEKDLWLELGPPEDSKKGNPLGQGIRVRASPLLARDKRLSAGRVVTPRPPFIYCRITVKTAEYD